MDGIKVVEVLILGWVVSQLFHIISILLMCTTIWIKNSRIAFVARSKGCKFYDQACRLVYVGNIEEPTIRGLTIFRIWTYDLPDHLMVDLEPIIALAFMTYVVHLMGF